MPVLGPSAASTNNTYEDQALPRNTVHEVIETPILAVKFTDGYGKTQMRLVVMIEGNPFLLHPDISEKAKAGQRWFAKQIQEKLSGPPAPTRKVRKTRKKVQAPPEAEAAAAPPINPDAM